MKFPNIASKLKSATTNINIASASTPSNGQVLTATSSTTATWQTPAGAGDITSTKSTFIAGENITAGNALYIKNIMGGGNFGRLTTYNKISQRILLASNTVFNNIYIRLEKEGNPTDNVVVRIETDNAGSPSGTLANANATFSIAGTSITSNSEWNINFIDFTLNAGTYHIVLARSGAADDTNYYYWKGQEYQSIYSDRIVFYYNGTNWVSGGGNYLMYNFTGNLKSEAVLKTDASNSSKINFIGFATANASTGNTVTVDTSGVSATQSGLTVGSDYYLSNTAGAISTTPGTNVRRIGRSVSTTAIELETSTNNSLEGTLGTTATTGSVVLGNAVGYITVKINGVDRKIPYYS